MCTVTVYQNDTGLLVTMNRDEARTRGEELPPTYHQREADPRWLGPLDGETRGTWIGVNEHGLVACLLNRYQNYATATLPKHPQSRGSIVPGVLRNHNVASAEAWLMSDDFNPDCFPPFTLLLLEPGRGLRLDWTGEGPLEQTPLDRPWAMISSSFFDPDRVLPWRTDAFTAWRDGGATATYGLPDFHRYQPEGLAALSPLMARDISCTRSITQVRVGTSAPIIRLHHGPVSDGRIDWSRFEHPWTLPPHTSAGGPRDAP